MLVIISDYTCFFIVFSHILRYIMVFLITNNNDNEVWLSLCKNWASLESNSY